MTDETYRIDIPPEIAAMYTRMIDKTGLTAKELLQQAMLVYHPNMLKGKNLENLSSWIVLSDDEIQTLEKLAKLGQLRDHPILDQIYQAIKNQRKE